MFKKILISIMVLALIFGVGFINSESVNAFDEAEYEEWLQRAQFGEYQPEEEDWDEILEKAKEEPPITIYSGTSRSIPVADALNEEHGLEIEVLNIRANEIVERVRREFSAGLHEADIIMAGAADAVYDQLLLSNAITRYVPRHIEEAIDPRHIEPLMVHRYSVGTWYYSTDEEGVVPYENIWELTTEKWNNRIAMQSPLDSGTTMDYAIGIVSNADKMEELYEDYFGEPIELTTENAGYEFLKRLLDNDARILDSFRDVADAVTRADGHFAGFGTQSPYRDVIEGIYDFELDTDINPAVLSPRVIAVGTFTESPNKVKYVINHLVSQEGGEPWWGADFPANPFVESTGAMADLTLDSFDKLWDTPLDQQLILRDQVADFFIMHE